MGAEMLKFFVVAAVVALPFLLNAGEARANMGGYATCPVNTCANNGGDKTTNVKACKASNCRKNKTK
jgi:hypothetical protein